MADSGSFQNTTPNPTDPCCSNSRIAFLGDREQTIQASLDIGRCTDHRDRPGQGRCGDTSSSPLVTGREVRGHAAGCTLDTSDASMRLLLLILSKFTIILPPCFSCSSFCGGCHAQTDERGGGMVFSRAHRAALNRPVLCSVSSFSCVTYMSYLARRIHKSPIF